MISVHLLHSRIIKYLAIAWVNIKERLAYRAEIVTTLLKNAFVLWVSYTLFTATYQSQNVSNFAGLSVIQIIWILVIIRLYRGASRTTGIIKQIMNEVKSGDIAYTLNRPMTYIGYHGAAFFGAQIPVMFFNLIVGSILALLWVGPIQVSMPALLGTAWLVLGGLAIEFFLQVAIGLLAFWLEDVIQLGAIAGMLRLIFGGSIIPIALLPEPIKTIALWSPFGNTFYTAGLLFVDYNAQLLRSALLFQALWLIILGGLTIYIFKRGIRNVSINGG